MPPRHRMNVANSNDACTPMIPRRLARARLNAFGDLLCPSCGAQLITPPGHYVRCGPARCTVCSHEFRVATATARGANRRADALAARLAMEALVREPDP